MDEQNIFFSKNREGIALIITWAKRLAWIMLMVHILLVIIKILGLEIEHQRFLDTVNFLETSGFVETVKGGWLYKANLILELLNILLKGVTYFMLLMGLSFGLNSIVEVKDEKTVIE